MGEGQWYERQNRKFHISLECGHGYVSANPIYPGAPYLCTKCRAEGKNGVMEVTSVIVAMQDTTEGTENG